MLRIGLSETFWAPVEIEYTTEEGAKAVHKFEVRFKRHDMNELEQLRDLVRVEGLDDRDIARKVMLEWRKFKDADGQPVVYSDEAREEVLAAGFGGAIALAFFSCVPKAKQKN